MAMKKHPNLVYQRFDDREKSFIIDKHTSLKSYSQYRFITQAVRSISLEFRDIYKVFCKLEPFIAFGKVVNLNNLYIYTYKDHSIHIVA